MTMNNISVSQLDLLTILVFKSLNCAVAVLDSICAWPVGAILNQFIQISDITLIDYFWEAQTLRH